MRSALILRLVLACVLGATAFGHARAAEHGGGGAATEAEGAQYVDISPVGLPVVYQRQLINYVFVSVRINLTPRANAALLREKEPYFRDALVKLGHRRPFTRLDDFASLDEAGLRAAMAAEAARIAGPGQVAGIQIMSQTPKRRSGLPRPPQAPQRPARAAAH